MTARFNEFKSTLEKLKAAALQAADTFEKDPLQWIIGNYAVGGRFDGERDNSGIVPIDAESCCLVGMVSKLSRQPVTVVEHAMLDFLDRLYQSFAPSPHHINDHKGREAAIIFLRQFGTQTNGTT